MAKSVTTSRNMFAQQKLLIANDPVFNWRERFTIAQVNAGAVILPAVPGYRYQLVDLIMSAIGGAAGGATTVDVNAVKSGVTSALMSAAIATLTSGALVRLATANAGSTSFIENDINTAISIGKTGAALTTATHVDIIISYRLVKTSTGAL
jgi:hypothetical protein